MQFPINCSRFSGSYIEAEKFFDLIFEEDYRTGQSFAGIESPKRVGVTGYVID
jgi:hypothetical protein